MKLNKVLYLILICFLFTSCDEVYIDMSKTYCNINKNTYQLNEDIELHIYGQYLPEEYVLGGAVYLWVYKNIENHLEESNFKLKKINEIEVFLDNEFYPNNIVDYYRYSINPKDSHNYMVDFDAKISFSTLEPGNYTLIIDGLMESHKRRFGGKINTRISFTVTE